MISIARETWDKLTVPTGERLVARPALPELTSRMLCALDASGARHILISLQTDDEEYADRQSRGVSVGTRELVIHGSSMERYLDMVCLDANGYAILDLMGGEIAKELSTGTRPAPEIVKRVLAKWRRFWGQIPQPMLSREEQLGLFAEIWFIVEWLIPKMGTDAVLAWRGPWGSRHDFEWLGRSVEVKATTSVRGRIHKIHGLDQLLSPENGALFLFSVSLREEGGAAHDLPGVIELCRHLLEGNEDGLAHFENALARIGYSPMFDDEYSKLKLRIAENVLFQVQGNFPRLTGASFSGGVPEGVERVEYEINLNSFDDLLLARQPDQMPFP